MSSPKTLRQISGANLHPSRFSDAVLVIIDAQNEYRSGALPLPQIDASTAKIAALLNLARIAGTPVVHIAHRGRAGGLFDRAAEGGGFLDQATPLASETIIEKTLPDAFAGTGLAAHLATLGRKKLILVGYMTHNCIAATAHAALLHGFEPTIVDDACATRALPDGNGAVIKAENLHAATLAGLADRVAIIAQTEDIR